MNKFSRDIRKRHNCVIRIGTVEIAGLPFIEIRQYYKDENDKFIPSKKMVSFRAELLDEMISGLNDLKQHFNKNA